MRLLIGWAADFTTVILETAGYLAYLREVPARLFKIAALDKIDPGADFTLRPQARYLKQTDNRTANTTGRCVLDISFHLRG